MAKKHIQSTPRPALHLSVGSEPGRKDLVYEQLHRAYGLAEATDGDWGIVMDFTPPHVSAPSGWESELDAEGLIGPQRFIRTQLPDQATLLEAEEAGDLCFMPAEWISHPESAKDNHGSGGNPRVGRAHTVINKSVLRRHVRRGMRRYADFRRKQEAAASGKVDRGDASRFGCHIHVSLPGGTGNGAVYEVMNEIARCAAQEKIDIKLILHGALLGTLATADGRQARFNEIALLKHLQAISTGRYTDPATGQKIDCSFSGILLYSNRNNHGGTDSLERINRVQALCRFAWEDTPAGAKRDERLVDLESHGADQFGDPCKAMTQSCSVIHLDHRRTQHYGMFRTIGMFTDRLLTEVAIPAVRREALEQARFLGIIESEADNQLTHTVIRPRDLDGESAAQRVESIFDDHIAGTRGLNGAITRRQAIESINGRDFPTRIEPAMIDQARSIRDKVTNAISEQVADRMRQMTGVAQAVALLQAFLHILSLSRESLAAKGAAIRQQLEPHETVIGECVERLEAIRKLPWIIRWWHFFTIRQINQVLSQSGRYVLRRHAELRAIEIAQSMVLKDLGHHVDRKLAEVMAVQSRLTQVRAWAGQQADRQVDSDDSFWAPLGHELADRSFLEQLHQDVIKDEGGPERLTDRLLAEFLGTDRTLTALGPLAETEIQTILESLCEEPFRRAAERLDVLDVYASRYSDTQVCQGLIRQRIHESRSAVPIVGAARDGGRIKIAMVPDANRAAWLAEILEAVDEDDSPWHIVSSQDSSTVMFLQVRNGLSLAPFIHEDDEDDPANWAQLLSRAPDPVSALIPNVRPTREQLQRVVLKGLVTGHIRHNTQQGYLLELPNGPTERLGQSVDELMACLERSYGMIVNIESVFAHHLVTDPDAIESAIDKISQAIAENGDPVLQPIDPQTVAMVRLQMQMLAPTLDRVRRASRRRRNVPLGIG